MSGLHIGRIRRGQTQSVYTSKARAILKLYQFVTTHEQPRVHRIGGYVDARLTRTALRGLAAQGFSRIWIRDQINLDFNAIWRITMDEYNIKSRRMVRRETQEAVLELARRVGSSDGGNAYVKSKAAARGWKPTMYCDELV
jgi:hypothetical protein